MLEEYKEAFRRCADTIDGWRELSKNELCFRCVANKGNSRLYDAYFAAIMYKYWHLIAKYYYQSSNVATWEDCYDWLEDSVYWALELNAWNDKSSSIYKDPNGPDKMINRCMKCARLTFYQYINRKKRRDNFGLLSLEEMSEQFGVTVKEPEVEEIEDTVTSWSIKDYIKQQFDKKDYFISVLLDLIMTQEPFDKIVDKETNITYTKFNRNKLSRSFNHIDDIYIYEFSRKYRIPLETAKLGFSYVTSIKSNLLKAKIDTALERLQHDRFFVMLRKGG